MNLGRKTGHFSMSGRARIDPDRVRLMTGMFARGSGFVSSLKKGACGAFFVSHVQAKAYCTFGSG